MKIVGDMTDKELLRMINEKEPGYVTVTPEEARKIYILPELTGKSFKGFLDRAYPQSEF